MMPVCGSFFRLQMMKMQTMIKFNTSQKTFALLLLVTLLLPSTLIGQTQSLPYMTPPRWSPDGTKVAVPLNDIVEIWDAATEQVIHMLEEHTDVISSIAWSPDSSMLATASSDQTVKLWSATDGSLLNTLEGHNDAVTAVTWSTSGDQVVSSALESEPSLFVWDSITGSLLSTHSEGTVVDMAFSPSGAKLALSASLVISIRDGRTLESIDHSPRVMCCANQMYALAWSPDGDALITGSINGLVTLWDANTGQMLNQFVANPYHETDSRDVDSLALSWVRDVASAPDGRTVLAVSGDGTVREWSADTGDLVQEMQIIPLSSAAWSPYTGRLAVLSMNEAESTDAQDFDATEVTGTFRIIVPDPSPERLEAIAAVCAPDMDLAFADLSGFIAQVAVDESIPPACAADLIAVAEALQALTPTGAQDEPQATASDVYLLRDNQLMHLDPQTSQTHLVTEFAPLSTVRSTEPDRTERRLYAADIDPAAQYLYQIEVWGHSSNRRIPNAPTGGELVRIDISTRQRQVIFDGTTVYHFILSPDGQRMILFYYDGEFLYSKPQACILDLQSFQCKDLTFDYVLRTSFWIDNDTFVTGIVDFNPLRLVDAVTGSHKTLTLPPEWHIYSATLIPGSNSLLVDTHPRELVDRIPPISFLTYDLETGNVQLLPYTALDTGEYTIVNELQFSPGGDYLLYRAKSVSACVLGMRRRWKLPDSPVNSGPVNSKLSLPSSRASSPPMWIFSWHWY